MDGSGRIAAAAIDDRAAESSVNRRESQIVVEKLGVLHDHERVAGVRCAHVVVDVCGYHSSAGQLTPGNGNASHCGKT